MSSRDAGLRGRLRQERGAQMVEFALVFLFLLMPLTLGIINFGYLFGQKLALNQGVREGTRQAVVPGTNNGQDVDTLTEIEDVVQASMGGLVPGDEVSVVALDSSDTATPTGCDAIAVGDELTLTATYDASILVPMPIPGFPKTFSMTSESVFRCEW